MRVDPKTITVTERQRKGDSVDGSQTLSHIEELSASIAKYGLLQSPLVQEDEFGHLTLVAGFNRLQAVIFLGWPEIEVKVVDALSPIESKEMELEENIRRKSLEWWEEASAVAEIHEMRVKLDPNWSMQKTAELIGKSKATVSQSVDLVNAVEEDPSIKAEATLRGALRSRQVTKKIEQRKRDIARREIADTTPAVIVVGDALKLIKAEPDKSFDAVITNFPFGVDLKLGRQGKKVYEDDEDYICELVYNVTREAYRVLKPDSWMVAWFDIKKICCNSYQKRLWHKEGKGMGSSLDLIYSMGLTHWMEMAGFSYVTTLPAIWAKPNKTSGMIGDPHKGMICAYEALVFAAKGDAVLHRRGRNNLFIYDTPPESERVHPLQMPTDLCAEIVSMVCLGGSHILDPFSGSGSIGLGALEQQCSYKGFEIDVEKASNGNLRLQEHIHSVNG